MVPSDPASLTQFFDSAIPVGLYRHYKGGLYQVLGTATHSETEDPYVVYAPLESNRLWIRPLGMFTETVTVGDYCGPRFVAVEREA